VQQRFVRGVPGGDRDPAAPPGLLDQVHGAQVGEGGDHDPGEPGAGVDDVERAGHLRGRLGEQPQLRTRLLGLGQGGPTFLLDHHPLGDVVLHADEVHDLARAVGHRRDRHLVPVGGAVAPVVQQDLGDRFTAAQGVADPADGGRIGVGPLQEPAVAADDLVQPVAGEAGERRVDPDQRVVRPARIGDRERHLRGDHRAVAQQRQPALVAQLRARELLEHDHRPRGTVAVEDRGSQREPGDPQQPALPRLPLDPAERRSPAGRVVHGDRFAGDGHTGRDQRER